METFTLNNGVSMPVAGLGTFKMGGEECSRSVAEAVRCGYRMIDTAEAYKNEEFVGAGIADGGVAREELFIVTKVNYRSFESARKAVESSMKKMRTDYLDMVLLHWPFGNYYAAWRELEKLYCGGRIRAIGVSNFNPDRLLDLIEFNEVIPAVNQVEMHLLCQRRAERCWMDKLGVRCVAYAPLGQGRRNEMFANPSLKKISASYGKTPAQTALRFLVQSGAAVVPKSAHADRMRENFDIFDFELSAGEMAELEKMDTGIALAGIPENPHRVEALFKQ